MSESDHDVTIEHVRAALRAAGGGEDVVAADLVWLGRNLDRIDARLRGSNVREHHVVGRMDSDGLRIELVLTEPDDAPAQVPLVVVVNGPSGAGKSVLLRAIAELSEAPWITFDEPILGTADQRWLVWRERAPHIHTGFLDGIAAVAAAGNAVAVAAGGLTQSQFRAALQGVRALYVGLDCPLPVLLERERGREGRWGGLAIQSLGIHDGWSYDLRLDSSESSPIEEARAVLALVG